MNAVAAVLLLAVGVSAAPRRVNTCGNSTLPYFDCVISHGFARSVPRVYPSRKQKVYGTTLVRYEPTGSGMLYAYYYAEGNAVQPDAHAYAQALPHPKTGPIEGHFNGRAALLVTRDVPQVLRQNGKPDVFLPSRQEIYVVPAKKGFYVFEFDCPLAAWAIQRPEFDRLAKGFQLYVDAP